MGRAVVGSTWRKSSGWKHLEATKTRYRNPDLLPPDPNVLTLVCNLAGNQHLGIFR